MCVFKSRKYTFLAPTKVCFEDCIYIYIYRQSLRTGLKGLQRALLAQCSVLMNSSCAFRPHATQCALEPREVGSSPRVGQWAKQDISNLSNIPLFIYKWVPGPIIGPMCPNGSRARCITLAAWMIQTQHPQSAWLKDRSERPLESPIGSVWRIDELI